MNGIAIYPAHESWKHQIEIENLRRIHILIALEEYAPELVDKITAIFEEFEAKERQISQRLLAST